MTSKVTDVTVYVNGASITRSQKFDVKEGKNTVKFENLPIGMEEQSIIVESEDITILSVSHKTRYLTSDKNDKDRMSGLSKLDKFQKELQKEDKLRRMLDSEMSLLAENSKMTNSKIFRASDVKDSVMFFHERTMQIIEEKTIIEDRMKDLGEKIANLQAELGAQHASNQASEVTVEIFSEKKVEAELRLSYFVWNARWVPYYDIRAKDTKDPVKIQSKAMVYQVTGEDWVDVAITLSTGNPSLPGNFPDLSPWYLNFDSRIVAQSGFQSFNASMKKSQVMAEECEACCIEDAKCLEEVTQTENLTSVEYVLRTPYTIETSGDGRSVDINSSDLPAVFLYKSVRKLEKDVFLVAEIGGWEGLNLLEGEASVFFEGKYVGKTRIDPRRSEGTLSISLGRDKNVIVTRVKGKDFTSNSTFGNNVKASREWVLTVRNLKKQKIDIVLQDQIPVSVNKSIVVDATNISGATLDKDTGKLEWKLELEPAASKSMNVKYEVSYPKGELIRLE